MYLDHHDVHARVLHYEPATGAFAELARTALPAAAQTDWGFYVSHGGHLFGVYQGEAGPVFFRDGERFPLADPACRLELVQGAQESCFRLLWQGQERVVVRYAPAVEQGTHPWDSPEMNDFFLWVSRLPGQQAR